MSDEWEYNWKKALLTSVVLLAGSCIIFAINSSGVRNPAWNNFGMVVVPSLLFISFAPLGFSNLITKWRKEVK